jgi:disulfide bond formation protein DsbB
MKITLWQWEYDFDRNDTEIVVPLVLLLLGLAFTPLNKAWLWSGGVAYYLLYFFLRPCILGVKHFLEKLYHWWIFRCPYCKSREVVLQGYQGYHSDEQYAFHRCNRCTETSVLVNEKLIKASR